ncbi:MAG: cyclic nucleotide-binding domain-containing protein [Desulfobulbaceae bacterium]|uniref:Cyclic nucleotide-binding domain-containing protein n=1 Tax=Candidatus Desulfatifera sulfidica TaxID=2841691 RepID=A0A8J6NAT5_9BACT|nr:cyclic nucleotide-binding domain-containing protein [Candidatus Desulfatifera sulfidica]
MSLGSISEDLLGVAVPFFNAAERALLVSYLVRLELAEGEDLFGVGEPVDGLYFLVRGRLAVRKLNPLYGKAQVVALLDPGAMVGEAALLGAGNHRAEVRAVVAAQFLFFDNSALERLSQDYFQLYFGLFRRALEVSSLRLDKVSERLAVVL